MQKTHSRNPVLITLGVVLVILLAIRVHFYIRLDTEWNCGQRTIRSVLKNADHLEVERDYSKEAPLMTLNSKFEVQHFLRFIVFERSTDVSFWSHPMIAKGSSKPHRYAPDALKIWLSDDTQQLGYLWIQGSTHALTFVPVGGVGAKRIQEGFEYGVLTEASYNNISHWFLTYGVPYYVKTNH